jgi:hypothetical protein
MNSMTIVLIVTSFAILIIWSTRIMKKWTSPSRERQIKNELSPNGESFLKLLEPFNKAIDKLEKYYDKNQADIKQIKNEINSISHKDDRNEIIDELKQEIETQKIQQQKIQQLFIQLCERRELLYGRIKHLFLIHMTPKRPEATNVATIKKRNEVEKLIQNLEKYHKETKTFINRQNKLEKPIIDSTIPLNDNELIHIHSQYKKTLNPITFHINQLHNQLETTDLQIDALRALQHKVEKTDYNFSSLPKELQQTIREIADPFRLPKCKLPDSKEFTKLDLSNIQILDLTLQEILKELEKDCSVVFRTFG